MISFTALKTRKPRQFEYKPRHFNPEKEAREKRRKELLGPDASDLPEGEYKPGQYIRGSMTSRRGMGGRKTNKSSLSITMGIAMLLLLGIAVWWVLN